MIVFEKKELRRKFFGANCYLGGFAKGLQRANKLNYLCKLAEINLMHVTFLDECIVECVSCSEVVPRLTLL